MSVMFSFPRSIIGVSQVPAAGFRRRGHSATSRRGLEMNNFILEMKQQMPGQHPQKEAERDEVEPYQRAASGFPALGGDKG